ncbi:hypothetical protein RHGRI_002586 [Rhododendron griersonianum]|uniref:Uncharacterized protein n=1 Tax=Rhododendron griersonianum TaxID=479676 RepID=A0AAV6LQP8_9ERIC|nr:hypothetical protein RHGRI_002586 [Rhododendron griersonianum]
MLAAKRVLLGPWHRGPGAQLTNPNPIVKNKFSSILVGTSTLPRLFNCAENAVTVAVSLKAGNCGKIGLEGTPLLAD